MAIIEPSHIGHTPFQQLLGHHEDIMKTWSALSDTLENTNVLKRRTQRRDTPYASAEKWLPIL